MWWSMTNSHRQSRPYPQNLHRHSNRILLLCQRMPKSSNCLLFRLRDRKRHYSYHSTVAKSAVSVKTKKRFILQSPFGSLEGAFIFAEDVIYHTSAAPMFRERRGMKIQYSYFCFPFRSSKIPLLLSVLIYTFETAKVKA